MIVIGGIVGAGIFRNPHVVASQVHTPFLILGAWLAGGVIALGGAFIYAELSATRDAVGGQYAYFREAFHPALAFVYGWAMLLVIQTGGMAAVSVTLADYSLRLLQVIGADAVVWHLEAAGQAVGIGSGKLVAVLVLGILTMINCLGVRAGTFVQSALTVLKMLAIAGLVVTGLFLAKATGVTVDAGHGPPALFDEVTHFGAAMVPVLFAYGGWQTACFIAGEVKNPKRNLPLGLLLGVVGVVVLYLSVNWVCLEVLGVNQLASTNTPAADVAERAHGMHGSFFISSAIVISTLGFLSQGMLTAPRVYFAMAEDGLFFRSLAWVHPKTRVPVGAIVLQGLLAMAIALTGRYEQILNYVVSVDFVFYGLTALCVFVFRRRDGAGAARRFRVPGHPITTVLFISCCWLVVLNSIYAEPVNSLVGLGLMLTALPAYWLWRGPWSRARLARQPSNSSSA